MTMIEHLITSSVLMLCILLIRMLFGNRMSQRLKYGLWLLVAIKLLVPLPMYEADISIMNVVQFMENQIGNKTSVKLSTEDVTAENYEGRIKPEKQNSELKKEALPKSDTQNVNHTDTKNTVEKQSELNQTEKVDSVREEYFSMTKKEAWKISLQTVCMFIWFLGVLLCGSCFLFSNMKFYFRLKKDRKETNIYPAKLKIYETNCVNSPCLFGMIKPAIYLPAGLLAGKEKLHHIMTHELTHYRHKDHIWTYIRCLCVVIYWYHPLVWLSAFLSIKDSELACDEGAVKCLGEENRKAYGVTLIEMASGYSAVSNRLVCSTSIMGGKKEMKKRIEMLVKKPKMLVSTFAAFLVLVISVTGCTFSSAKNEEEKVAEIEKKADANATKTKGKDETKEPVAIEQTEKTEETLQPVTASLETKFEDVPEGAYCLWFFPDELCFRENFVDGVNSVTGVYYVPEKKMQKKIKELLENPEKKEKRTAKRDREYQEYKDKCIRENGKVTEAGFYLEYKKDKEEFIQYNVNLDGIIEDEDMYMVNPALCKLLSEILKEEFQYEPLDRRTIKDIESATLEYRHPKNKKLYSQTITDKETLGNFEYWLAWALPYYSGDKPYYNGLLTLTLKNGKVIRMSMDSTGNPYYLVNGHLYNYGIRNKIDGFNGYTLMDCFDTIPYYNYLE